MLHLAKLFTISLSLVGLLSIPSYATDDLPQAKVRIPTVMTQAVQAERVPQGNVLELANGKQIKLKGLLVPELENIDQKKQWAERFGLPEKKYNRAAKDSNQFLKTLVRKNQFFLINDTSSGQSLAQEDEFGRPYHYVFGVPRRYEYVQFSIAMKPRYYEKSENDKFHLNVGATMVQNGFAMVDRKLPFQYRQTFEALEEEAKTNKRGLWKYIH